MAILLAWFRLAVSGLLAALPSLRKGKAEREAGLNPRSVPATRADPLLDSALRRLGTVSRDDSLWKQFTTGITAVAVRPDHFRKPHVREWLSRPEVVAALKNLAKAELVDAPEPEEDREKVVSAYIEVSGENRSYAESNVLAALAFLKASIQAAAKDPGTAAITQVGFSSVHNRFDEQDSKLDAIAASQALHKSGAIAEHHGDDAKSTLDAILRRRASPGQDTLAELRDLARFLDNDGKFAAAPKSVTAQVYDWIARVEATKGHVREAEDALAVIAKMGHRASSFATAWVEAARGEVDTALRMLGAGDSAESRSVIFGLLRVKKGAEAAIAYLDALEVTSPDTFTPVGWTIVAGCLAEKGLVERATSLLAPLPDGMLRDFPILAYMRGLVYVANSVSEDLRGRVVREEYLAACDHMLDGVAAENWRAKAHDSFELCREWAQDAGDQMLAERTINFLRWLRLVIAARKEEEIAALRADMNDGKAAVDLMPLAHAFDVKFDSSALTKHLERAEMLGGLSLKELNAKVLLLAHLKRFPELAAFIVDNWGRLAEAAPVAALGGMLIQAYVQAGECERAEETLQAKLPELYPPDVQRYRLMIAHARGEDPTKQARDNYKETGAIEDLVNLVRSLEGMRRWTDLAPYAFELFKREPNAGNARRHVECLRQGNAPDEDILLFLDNCHDLVEADPELTSARAWALFHLGRVEESGTLNERLLSTRRNINDLGLDINLAVRTGNWERLPAILDREWSKRADLPVGLLLYLARVTSSNARERALQVVTECVDRDPNNAHSLLQAYSVAAAMARDDIGMPLVNRAAHLSKGQDGPVKSVSTREIVEMMRASADDWRRKNDLFRTGDMPIHWAAQIFNVPLSRLLIAIPRENKSQGDGRRRQPIPTRAGSRSPIESSAVKRLALDITSIFILSELGFLGRVIDALDAILLSPRIMEMLLFEEEKVRFHQPSRIEAAKPLLELRRKRLLALAEADGPPDLVAEVGEEEAGLLASAKLSGGLCIHSGKLYRIGSFMDEEAQLGDFAESVASPAAVATALFDEGFITATLRDKALEYLKLVSAGEIAGRTLAPKAPVFLDRVSAQYLSEVELLGYLVRSSRQVFVHPSAIEEWQTLADTEPYSQTMVEALETVRRSLREGMAKGRVRFLREWRRDDDEARFGGSEAPMRDLFEDVSWIDAVCIDDRLLNSKRVLEDRHGKNVNLLCSLDVIDLLVARRLVTVGERAEAIHRMRESCLCMLPVDPSELLELLSQKTANATGTLSESTQLRVIREYLARLHSSDFLCAASDLEYMDELWRTGQKVIRKLWADGGAEIADIVARADWVVDHVIPDIELALRFAPNGKDRMEEIALSRMVGALLPVAVSDERWSSYAEWLERKIIAPYLPACSAIIDKAAKQIGTWVMTRSVEMAHAIESHGSEEAN